MPRFRVMYEKHHVKAIIRKKDAPLQQVTDSELTACTYIREARLWLLTSDYVKLAKAGLANLEDGTYLKFVIEPLTDSVKFLLRDSYHGINFKNFLNEDEYLELYVRVLKDRPSRQILKKFPRQIAKLLRVEQVKPLYENTEITAGIGYFLQEIAYSSSELTDIVLELWGKYRVFISRSKSPLPLIVLKRGELLCLAFPLAKLALFRIYRTVNTVVKVFQADSLNGRCVIVCLER